jgi:hypothetical protein
VKKSPKVSIQKTIILKPFENLRCDLNGAQKKQITGDRGRLGYRELQGDSDSS